MSGYGERYRKEVVTSGVTGFERHLEASQRSKRPLFWPKGWKKEVRRGPKMVRRVAWYRPADCVGFFPATPKGELNQIIGEVLEEEGKRIGMVLKLRAGRNHPGPLSSCATRLCSFSIHFSVKTSPQS